MEDLQRFRISSTNTSCDLISPRNEWKVDGGLWDGFGTGMAEAVRRWNRSGGLVPLPLALPFEEEEGVRAMGRELV